MGVWQGVAMDSFKFHLGPPCPTLPRPTGRPPLKRPYALMAVSEVACPQGGRPVAIFYPLDTRRRTPMSDDKRVEAISDLVRGQLGSNFWQNGVSRNREVSFNWGNGQSGVGGGGEFGWKHVVSLVLGGMGSLEIR
jgi:hypothetical protein